MAYRNEYSVPFLVDSTTVEGSVAATSTGAITLISSGAGPIYVFGYDVVVESTAVTTMRLVSGSTTAECWRLTLGGAASTTGIGAGSIDRAQQAINPPNWIFRTNPGDPLTYDKGASSVTGAIASFSFAFWRG